MQAEYNMPVSDSTDAYIRTLINYTPKNKFAPGGFTADSYGLLNLFLARAPMTGNGISAVCPQSDQNRKAGGAGDDRHQTPAIAQTALGLARSSGYRSVTLTPRREFGVRSV